MYVHVYIHGTFMYIQVSGPFTVVLMTVASTTLSWSPSSDKQREYNCVCMHACAHVFMVVWVL